MTQPIDRYGGGISLVFLRVWGALLERGTQTVGEIATACGVPRGTVKGIVDKMVNAGQVEENANIHPRQYRRRTRTELNKDEREYRTRIERAIASLR
jgi:DNA-binding MarR family transcriptional regulator